MNRAWSGFIKQAVITLMFVVGAMSSFPAYAQEADVATGEKKYERLIRANGNLELGFVSVLGNKIKYDVNDTYLDYVKHGGQDILFFNWRISMDLTIKDVHTLIFLYQPLELLSTVSPRQDLRMDGKTFLAGNAVTMRYSFPFYRLSYHYDFFKNPRHELSLGLGIQLRNATIEFVSGTGAPVVSKRDIGVVPLLKLRGRYGFANGFWLGGEVDGIYAPISYLNGSDNETVGAFIDLSVRGGYTFNRYVETFLNLRYIGGGAANEEQAKYVRNWIHLLAVTIGVTGML